MYYGELFSEEMLGQLREDVSIEFNADRSGPPLRLIVGPCISHLILFKCLTSKLSIEKKSSSSSYFQSSCYLTLFTSIFESLSPSREVLLPGIPARIALVITTLHVAGLKRRTNNSVSTRSQASVIHDCYLGIALFVNIVSIHPQHCSIQRIQLSRK